MRQYKFHAIVGGASSSMPVMEVLPNMADDMSTTYGAMRPIDSTTDGSLKKNVGPTEGGPNVSVAESGKLDLPTC